MWGVEHAAHDIEPALLDAPNAIHRVAIDVVGRRDRSTVDLAYVRTSCGGLFSSGCMSSSGVAMAGGQELSLVASLGFMFGR